MQDLFRAGIPRFGPLYVYPLTLSLVGSLLWKPDQVWPMTIGDSEDLMWRLASLEDMLDIGRLTNIAVVMARGGTKVTSNAHVLAEEPYEAPGSPIGPALETPAVHQQLYYILRFAEGNLEHGGHDNNNTIARYSGAENASGKPGVEHVVPVKDPVVDGVILP